MNSLPSEDVGSKDGVSDGILKEEDNDDGNNDGTDGNADDDTDDCIGGADDEDDIFFSLVDNRSDDNCGYIIGIILFWVEGWEGWRKEFEWACWSLSNDDDSDVKEGSSDAVDDDSFRLGFSVELVIIVIVVVAEAFIKIIMIMIIIMISIWSINNSNNL